MNILNSDNLKQFLLIGLIIALGFIIGKYLFTFFPGLLGALTLYIIMRQHYFKLTVIHSWKKWVAAMVFIILAAVVIVLPVVGLVQMLIPKFSDFLSNTTQLNDILNVFSTKINRIAPGFRINEEQLRGLIEKLTTSIPTVLGATFNVLTNTVLALFILYFMLVDGRRMERTIQKYMPLKEGNIDDIWRATRTMVMSNAIGIPVIAICQACVAAFGYWLFGIDSFIIWGIMTGVFSLVPIIGTAVIWVPLCVYLIITGNSGQGFGLAVYSLVVTGTVDNILRFTILKKLGDVHPIITALGIIVGIPVFGFMGFIFGPLLISYLLLLIKIYRVEFSPRENGHS